MKLIGKILMNIPLLGILFGLEARQVELIFDQTVQQTCVLERMMSEPPAGSLSPRGQKIVIENVGDAVVTDCLPFVDQQALYTLTTLSNQISKEQSPLLALHHLWQQAIRLSAEEEEEEAASLADPLYLINFKGICNQQAYLNGFLQLCHQLDIRTRPVSMRGQEYYDFCAHHDWEFLDPIEGQMYLDWDNQTLLSSEEAMDDPLLMLRTKANRASADVDVEKNWQKLAHLAIAHSYLEDELVSEPAKSLEGAPGFTLYPSEKLVYSLEEGCQQTHVTHLLNLEARQQDALIAYTSPFPIKAVQNTTPMPIQLIDLGKTLQPGETLLLEEPSIFSLHVQANTEEGRLKIMSQCSWRLFPALKEGAHELNLGTESNPSKISVSYDSEENTEEAAECPIKVVNESGFFGQTPFFLLESDTNFNIEKIRWQISCHENFDLVPTNLEGTESYTTQVTLSPLSQTFLNAHQYCYFRVKAYVNGSWSQWSTPFIFTVKKPKRVESIGFDKLDQEAYIISWEAVDPNAEYLIFGSNSLDFIPSVYCDKQINAVVDEEIIEAEPNNNLVAITKDNHLIIDGSLAYYRIIARADQQLSVPSRLIYVYDQGLIQPRTVLQLVDGQAAKTMQRVPLSAESDPLLASAYSYSNPLEDITVPTIFRSLDDKALQAYVKSPHVSDEIWAIVTPYLLPQNHPIRAKMDRMFSATRITLTPETFKKAGFKRNRVGRFSRVMASGHPNLQGYFIKAFSDREIFVKADWKKWITRIEGANSLRSFLVRKGYNSRFKVPKKWIYPLPAEPSPPDNPQYLRKNFILVAEDMRIYESSENNKMYKKKMTRPILDAMYTILQEEGLWDSVYAFNMPFSKDGKIAFVDTEYHHKWPVPFHKLSRYLSGNMKEYWEKLIRNGGPGK